MTKARIPRAPSAIEETFALHCRALHVPEPLREFEFEPARKWRADFAWPQAKLIVECEGGVHSGGRHTRGKGFEADCEKYNAMTVQGWSLLRFTGKAIRNGTAVEMVRDFIAARAALADLLQGR